MQPVVEQFMSDVESSKIESVEQFALLALGEIGSKVPLGETVVKHQLKQFSRASESVKMSAAIGIGLVTSGNLAQLIPLLLDTLSSSDSPQISYLTLVSIREATKNASDDALLPFAKDLFARLQEYSGASEEGSRNVLAECLGRLVSVEPSLCNILQVLLVSLKTVCLYFARKNARAKTSEFAKLNLLLPKTSVTYNNSISKPSSLFFQVN